MTYLKNFIKKIEEGNYHEFLKIWEEYCYSDEPDPQELYQILLEVKNSPLAKEFGHHVEKGMVLWEKLPNSPQKEDIISLIYDIQTTNSENLAETAYLYLKDKYPNDELFDKKLHLIGLRTERDFQGAISNYALLTHAKEGKFVFHKGGWGTGEILDLSLIREEMSLEFEYVVGQKTLSFRNAMKTLLPIKDEHFLARRFGNPDLLEKEAKENPLKVLRLMLQDLGPKNAQEIKEELCDLVIPEEEWSKWWQTARTKLKKDTRIFSPKDAHDKYRLLEKEISHEELFYQQFDAKPNVNASIQMVYSFLKDFPQSTKNKEFTQNLVLKIEELLNKEKLTNPQKIQLHFFLHDLANKDLQPIEEIIKITKSLSDLVNALSIITFKKRLLVLLQKNRSDWEEIFLSLLFVADSNIIRDFLFKELHKDHKQKLHDKIESLLTSFDLYPEAFMWYFQKIIGRKSSDLPFSDIKGQLRFFEAFLTLLAKLASSSTHLDLAKKMISLITKERFLLVRKIFDKTSISEVKEFLLLATKCRLLSSHDIKILHSLAKVVHPSLAQIQKKEEPSDIIWATATSFKKMQTKIKHLATVEMIQNAREIEEARAHGDLRENAEYKAALERKQQLQGELKILSDQFNQAKILTKEEVDTSEVNVGTKITCTAANGNKTIFTILGPWDAEAEKNIISSSSKLARSMLHKKIGETFQFQDTSFEITAIENALE